jgi:hypothetical protein
MGDSGRSETLVDPDDLLMFTPSLTVIADPDGATLPCRGSITAGCSDESPAIV